MRVGGIANYSSIAGKGSIEASQKLILGKKIINEALQI